MTVADESGAAADARPSTADLAATIERSPRVRGGETHRVTGLIRRPSRYRSTWPIEDIDVLLDDGSTLDLLLKDLSPSGLAPEARRAKPRFMRSSRREIEVYRSILDRGSCGTAECFAARSDGYSEQHWLLLERVDGIELYQVGELETWKAAARWLAGFHGRMAREIDADEARAAGLLVYDAHWYRRWHRRAQWLLPRRTLARRAVARPTADWLLERYDEAIEHLCSLPATVIHGEFYASNVLVSANGIRVTPVDWEVAAVGPAQMDLAALVSGDWSESDRNTLITAYHETAEKRAAHDIVEADSGSFHAALDHCRLHVAMQWLAWPGNWKPPAEHAFDWLSEALRLAEGVR